MPAFTTAANVRLQFQLQDTTLVPNDLLDSAIDMAHHELLQRLDPVFDTETPPAALITAETFLAGARLLLLLATRSATLQPIITVGGQRLDRGREFITLIAAAEHAQQHAWDSAARYLNPQPQQVIVLTTATTEVLGERTG
jgi:hypothetical protein